jgi:hypothetical protein
VKGARGIWYSRADVGVHVPAVEIEAFVSAQQTTAMQRNNAMCDASGAWSVGGQTEILGDKFVRSRWPGLPYARQCGCCRTIKMLAAFAAAKKQGGFSQMRGTCRVCERDAPAPELQAVGEPSTTRTCNVCATVKPVSAFYLSRATCNICRNVSQKNRLITKARTDPDFCA